jgi:TnpA family transposase
LIPELLVRFCPRLADIGGTRFWRIDPQADYPDELMPEKKSK